MITTKSHWEKVFSSKTDSQKSWFEEFPYTSMNLIKELNIPKDGAIIEIGGGDSHLVDALLQEGFTDISVLDISENALSNAKARLGVHSAAVSWIVSDVLDFVPDRNYGCWHDRAVFHFITEEDSILAYIQKMAASINTGGHLILATFSENGPSTCSGLPVRRYLQSSMTQLFEPYFDKVRCFEENHTTPFHTIQSFTYCGFSRKGKIV